MIDGVDIAALFTAIENQVSDHFPDLNVFNVAPERQKNPKTPFCSISIDDFEKSDVDLGTEQLSVVIRFEASLVLGTKSLDAARQAVLLAASFAQFVDGQRWGLAVNAAEFETAGPDEFSPSLDKYEAWTVAWSQEVRLGESVWTNDGTLPETVLVSTSPEIGIPNEDAYEEVTGQ